jgi:hypothetical protein
MNITISPKFWRAIGPEAFLKIAQRNGVLDEQQCAILWMIEGREGQPPKSLQLMLEASEVIRAFPPRGRFK